MVEFRSCWAFSWAVRKVTFRLARYCSNVILFSLSARSRRSTTCSPSVERVWIRCWTVETRRSPNSCIMANAARRWGKMVGYLSRSGKLKNKGLKRVFLMIVWSSSRRCPGRSNACACEFRCGSHDQGQHIPRGQHS